MTVRLKVLLPFLGLIIVASAANSAGEKLYSSFEIRYGIVEQVQKVKAESKAMQNAVGAGIAGAAFSSHKHRGRDAAGAALAAILLTKMMEGKHRAYAYTVALTNGDEVRVVIETGHIQTGDCVAVEQGRSANIRRVTSAHCESGAHIVRSEPIVHASLQHDAAECHAVKELALQAETEEQIDVAIKKVRMFCEH